VVWLYLVVFGIVYVPGGLFFLQVGGLARCVLLMSCPLNQASSFYFTSGCMARYTDRCHSMFSKIVFITYMLLRKVGHCGDPPDGVSCGSCVNLAVGKFVSEYPIVWPRVIFRTQHTQSKIIFGLSCLLK
jgi:hypothetical protein